MKPKKPIDTLILEIRGQKVILDADLAELFGVPIKVLNQAVKRNADRFPDDFIFQLTPAEWSSLRSQFVTLNLQPNHNKTVTGNWSQFATLKTGRGQHRKYAPYAFTEHGAIMAAMVLNSPEAVAMSVYVVRAFIQMREQIAANAAILKRLAEIDKSLLKHDKALQIIWTQLQPLLQPVQTPTTPKPKIGFQP